jgi:hypothetical protein
VAFVTVGGGNLLAVPVEIQQAIDRGVHLLKQRQSRDGAWIATTNHVLGETALAGLALQAAGVVRSDRSLQGALNIVTRLAPSSADTYDVSLAIMFLDSVGQSRHASLARQLGDRLRAGQSEGGAWSYIVPVSREGMPALGQGDNSNTQFAALATWVSRRRAQDNDEPLRRLDAYFRRSVDSTQGGWGYRAGSNSTPSMTCAGLVALATYRGVEQQRLGRGAVDGRKSGELPSGRSLGDLSDDPIVRRALTYLGDALAGANADGSAKLNRDLYFFWSLERVGVVYAIDRVGGIDWYDWGANRLIRMQSREGGWKSEYQETVDTSFAILFLSRANVAADLTSELTGGTPSSKSDTSGGRQFLQRLQKTAPPSNQSEDVSDVSDAASEAGAEPSNSQGRPLHVPSDSFRELGR